MDEVTDREQWDESIEAVPIPPPLYVTTSNVVSGYLTWSLVCLTCGAKVSEAHVQLHTDYHLAIERRLNS